MSAADLLLVLLGCYLAVTVVIASWRRTSQSLGGVGVWVALLGGWHLAAAERWLPVTLTTAIAATAACLAVAGLLIHAGERLGRRGKLHGWVWLLGPMHALGLAVSWIAAARLRRREAARRAPRSAPGGMHAAIESVTELGETTLEEVMVPRSEIRALPEGSRVADWLALARESQRGLLPVYRDDLDEIVGYLRSADLLGVPPVEGPIQPHLRNIRFVPESMRCDDLLRDQIAQGERIAIVVDEFGGTAGLVTNQDLFEILLGEIDQESAARGLWRVSPRVYLAEGGLRIDDFNEFFSVQLPAGDYETIAGLLLDHWGRIPCRGERVAIRGVRFEVSAASPRRVLRVRVTLPPAAEGAQRGDR